MHVPFTLSNSTALVELLAVGGVLAYVAERRRWHPPLWVALAVGLALRVQLMLQTHMIQPYDIYYDYHYAGLAVLHHQDPILNSRPSGWTFLPLYGFVLAGEVVLQHSLHITWIWAVRSFALLADLAVIVLVGVVAGRRTSALRRFQYACYPLALLYSAGRMDVTCLALSLGAFALLLHRRSPAGGRRAAGAGALLGLAVGVNSWPILFLPGLWRALPSARRRVQATAGLAGVVGALFVTMPLTVGTPVADLLKDGRTILTYHGTIGTFGWSAVVADFYRLHWYNSVSVTIGAVGAMFTLVAVVTAVWLWRRAHPVDLAAVTPCALLAATASFGTQYLLWPVPFLLARPPKRAWLYHGSVIAWTILLVWEWGLPRHLKYTANVIAMVASILVVPAIIAAMPWERRSSVWPAARVGVPRPRDAQQPVLPGPSPGGSPPDSPPQDGRPGSQQPQRRAGDPQPDGRRAGDSQPTPASPGNGQPTAASPGDGQPTAASPGDGRPGDGASRDGRPADGQPGDGQRGDGQRGGRPAALGARAFSRSSGSRGRPRWWPDRASGSLPPCRGCRS